jgi:hypothetical protein
VLNQKMSRSSRDTIGIGVTTTNQQHTSNSQIKSKSYIVGVLHGDDRGLAQNRTPV